MLNHEHLLSHFLLDQFFHRLITERCVHKVVELCDNSQGNEVVHNVDGVQTGQDNDDVHDFHQDNDCRLQEANDPSLLVALEQVRVVETKLHVVKPCTNLVDQTQMQNSSANKASKQNDHTHISREVRLLDRVCDQVIEDSHDQHDLAKEAQQHMQKDVESLSLTNLILLLKSLHDLLFANHNFVGFSFSLIFKLVVVRINRTVHFHLFDFLWLFLSYKDFACGNIKVFFHDIVPQLTNEANTIDVII